MNRRQLLARLLGGSIGVAATEIWLPGERLISLPPRRLFETARFAYFCVGADALRVSIESVDFLGRRSEPYVVPAYQIDDKNLPGIYQFNVPTHIPGHFIARIL